MVDIVENLLADELPGESQHVREARITLAALHKEAAEEIKRLREKCDMQTMILRRLTPEHYPDTFFITGMTGTKDRNGLPENLLVCPAYGVDFSCVYERKEKTVGPEW